MERSWECHQTDHISNSGSTTSQFSCYLRQADYDSRVKGTILEGHRSSVRVKELVSLSPLISLPDSASQGLRTFP